MKNDFIYDLLTDVYARLTLWIEWKKIEIREFIYRRTH